MTDNNLGFYVHGTTINSGVTATADTWYHVTATYDGATAQIYIDGDLKASQAVSSVDLSGNAQIMVVGGNHLADATEAQGAEFKGLIDEVRVWSDIRTGQEIRDGYQTLITETGNNLEVYYRFEDEDASVVTDHSGNSRHGTSAVGQVLTLDGTGDYVEVADNAALNVANWTIESWFQTTAHTASGDSNIGRLVSKAQATGGNQYSLYMLEGKIYTATNTITPATLISDQTYNDGQWHHTASVYDGSTLKLYVDGVLVKSSAVTGTPLLDTKSLNIGAYDDGSGAEQFFNGKIDEVRIWSDSRTQAEIREAMHQTVEADAGNLLAHYSFDDDVTAVDNNQGTGTLDGTLQGGATVTATASSPVVSGPEIINLPGKALDLNGSSQYISVPGLATSFDDVTVETWLKLDSVPAVSGYTMLIGSPSITAGSSWIQFVNDAGVTKILWNNYVAGAHKVYTFSHDFGENLNEWTHVSLVRDASTNVLTLYINGTRSETQTYLQADELTFDWSAVQIGSFDSSQYLDGSLSDFRIWNTARTGAEVESTYNQTLTGTQNGQLVANYVMDELTGTTLEDEAGGNHNATVVGSPTLVDVAPVVLAPAVTNLPSRALDLNGSSQYISVPDLATSFMDITVETWINFDSVPGVGSHAFLIGNSAGVEGDSYVQLKNEGGVYKLFWHDVLVGSEKFYTFSHNFADNLNEWAHISLVRDTSANSISLYVNGKLLETLVYLQADEQSIIWDDAKIGAYTIGGQYLDGSLSDFRVWSTARTGADIQAAYDQTLTGTQGGTLVVNYVMDELAGTTLADAAGGNHNGTIVGSPTIVDVAPSVASSTLTISEGETATGSMTATDVAGTATYTVSGLAASDGSVSIDASSGQWTYTPPDNWAGTATFNVIATGATSGTDTEAITVTVAADAEMAVHGGALQLDGVNDYVDLGTISGLSGAYTVEAWVSLSSLATTSNGYARILDLGQGENDDNIVVYLHSTTGEIGLGNSIDATQTLVRTTSSVSVDTWVHIAAVNNGDGSAAIYFNGVAQTLTGDTSSLSAATDVARTSSFIGRSNWAGDDYFHGMIDDVRIWNDARTAQEIADNYNEQIDPATAGLFAHYRFDEGSGTAVQDQTSNNNDGQIISSVTGPSGQVLQLDGSSDWVSIDNTDATQNLATGTGAFTYEAWIKTTKAGYQTVVSVGHVADDEESLFFLQTTGELSYHLRGSSPTITSAQKVNDGNWHHVAFVYDGADTGTLYIDGGVDGTGTGLTNTNITGAGGDPTAANARIGTQSTNNQEFFEGQMDSVRIWDTARTAEEIRDGMTRNYDYDATDLLAQ